MRQGATVMAHTITPTTPSSPPQDISLSKLRGHPDGPIPSDPLSRRASVASSISSEISLPNTLTPEPTTSPLSSSYISLASDHSDFVARQYHAESTPHPTLERPSDSATARCLALPFELYRPIIGFVTDQRDLRNLAVASRITQPDAERFLHATVSARGIRDVAKRCRFLVHYPRVAALVRKIIFSDTSDKTWNTCQPLTSFFALVAAALRNTPKLTYLDASILPTNSLPTNVTFRLETFIHHGLVIGLDAVNFFTEQSTIKNLVLNAFSYYELHDDDEHYRRLLYTILPNLRSLSCGLSVAIRLVKSRPLVRFVVPDRPDCLDSDQLERVVRALCTTKGSDETENGNGSVPPLKSLIVERKFAGREGLQCITKELKNLEHLSLVISYASEWLRDLSSLKYLRSLSVVGDTFFNSRDERIALEELRQTCTSLRTVYIRHHPSRSTIRRGGSETTHALGLPITLHLPGSSNPSTSSSTLSSSTSSQPSIESTSLSTSSSLSSSSPSTSSQLHIPQPTQIVIPGYEHPSSSSSSFFTLDISNTSTGSQPIRADHWEYDIDNGSGEWSCLGVVDMRFIPLPSTEIEGE